MDLITQTIKLKDVFPDLAGEIGKEYGIEQGDLQLVRKGLTPSDLEFKDGERAVISTITTLGKDRDGEVILPEGMDQKHYRKNPIVPWCHKYDQLPLGRNIWIKPDSKNKPRSLIAKTVYVEGDIHPFADQVYRYRNAGFPLAESIGFIPIKRVRPNDKDWDKVYSDWKQRSKGVNIIDGQEDVDPDAPRCIYTKWALLEYSDVPVPANPEALQIAISKGLLKEEGERVDVLKPEVTEDYIRVPVRECEITATIDISKEQGIKALYCGKVKKNATYLFDKAKGWTMAKAKAWVKEHDSGKGMNSAGTAKYIDIAEGLHEIKEYINEDGIKVAALTLDAEELWGDDPAKATCEQGAKTPISGRWNKSLPEVFDIRGEETPATTFQYNLFKKYLRCEVKDIFVNSYSIPSPLMPTYLSAFKSVLSSFKLIETRNFSDGRDPLELPPIVETIKLNSTDVDEFLVEGLEFYDADGKPLVVRVLPSWSSLLISLISSNTHKSWNKDVMSTVHQWAKENNYLKGEKFALSGEFLEIPNDDWSDLILDSKVKDAVRKSVDYLGTQKGKLNSRGLLFIGPPGTGKTMTGRAILKNSDATFVWVSARDFGRMYPDRALSLAFSLARDLSPSILFIEDIDTWLGGFTVDLLKTQLDGLRKNKGILTILTSNYPERLPDALLDRPGRFHHVLEFALPTAALRKEMLTNWIGTIAQKELDEIASQTDGFSGAHMKELVDFAQMIVEEEQIEIGQALLRSLEQLLAQRELISQIRQNKKSVTAPEEDEIDIEGIEIKETGDDIDLDAIEIKDKGKGHAEMEIDDEVAATLIAAIAGMAKDTKTEREEVDILSPGDLLDIKRGKLV